MSNPFSSPTTTVMTDESFAETPRTFGGIRRLPYWVSMIAIAVIHYSIFYYSGISLWRSTWYFVLYQVVRVVVNWYRLKNIGMDPWWSLLIVVPLINFFLVGRCAILPEGYAVTKKLDNIGKWLAFGIFLIIAVVLGNAFF